jgi:hypothetical protein
MKKLHRHILVVAVAALLAFVISPYLADFCSFGFSYTEESSSDILKRVAALAVGLVWLGFTLALRNPRPQKWLILGFLSPILCVPLHYQLSAWFAGYGMGTVGYETPLIEGLMVAGIFSWIFVPCGVIFGSSSAFITWLLEDEEAEQATSSNH